MSAPWSIRFPIPSSGILPLLPTKILIESDLMNELNVQKKNGIEYILALPAIYFYFEQKSRFIGKLDEPTPSRLCELISQLI